MTFVLIDLRSRPALNNEQTGRAMRNVAIVGVVLVAALVLAGCATSAAPRYVNGNYYMVGDASCVRGRMLSPTRIMCADKHGSETGYRDAMTTEQMQMYQMQAAQQQMQMQQLTQQLQQTSNQFNQMSQQSLQQMQRYTPPQVAPSRTYDTRCINVGIYTSCSTDQ